MFKPFYIHRFHRPGKLPSRVSRGFTALITPIEGDLNKVKVQGTFCSHKDQFSRKLGREQAARNEAVEINKRELPRFLAACNSALGVEYTESQFYYTLKYVV
jgi:hypothetical protein